LKRSISSLCRSLLGRLWTRACIIVYENRQAPTIDTPAEIVQAGEKNLADLGWFHSPEKLAQFAAFLQDGDAGYLAYLNGQCIHRSWVVCQPRLVPIHPLHWRRLGSNEVFIHYCETAASARGKSVYPAVLARIARDFHGRRLLIAVDETNQSSRRGVLKAGFEPVEKLYLTVFCGLKSARWEKIMPSRQPAEPAAI
jgi:hypothetical protein